MKQPKSTRWGRWIWAMGAGVLGVALAAAALVVSAAFGDLTAGTLLATGITAPAAELWLQGSLGGHLWVADHLQGFCRLDTLPGGAGVSINQGTCYNFGGARGVGAAGQASYDPDTRFVYVPNSATNSQGVTRLLFNPTTETVSSPTVLVPGQIQGAFRPEASALGPDGKLYIGYKVTGKIIRVANPASALPSVEPVGTTSDGRLTISLGFVGNDLYIVQSVNLTVIKNAASCTGGCIGAGTPVQILAPSDFAYDGSNALYVANISGVTRYNLTTWLHESYASTGLVNGSYQTFAGISALSFDAAGHLLVGDDPSLGRTGFQGRLWVVNGATQPPPPPPSPLATGGLLSGGLTAPAGQMWLPGALGGHMWVADHLQGFCRLDQLPGTKTVAINTATCNNLGKGAAGQPAYDPATQYVYVPDASAKSLGIWRLYFDPATETVGFPTVIAVNSGLALKRPEATAFGPDGKLYVGFKQPGTRIQVPNIVRIVNPGSAMPLVEPAGFTSDNRLTISLGFAGNDLYIAEDVHLTVIRNVAGCQGGCVAELTPVDVLAPTDFAFDGSTYLYVSDLLTVYRYNVTTWAKDAYANSGLAGGALLPFQGISALSFDTAGQLLVLDDPTLGRGALQGHVWTVVLGAPPTATPLPTLPPPTGTPSPTPAPPTATPPPPPSPAPGNTLYLSGLTIPAGTIWLPGNSGGHLWISDGLQGFCRLDPAPGAATTTINAGTCATLSKGAAGQAAFDPVTRFVYVPDSSSKSLGVYRLVFDPVSQTVGSPSLVAGGANLGTNRPGAVALGPDGKLYVSSLKVGNIVRIVTPAGTSQTVESVGASSDNAKVPELAFVGPNLYLTETANVTRIVNAAACTGACRGAAAGVNLAAPLSLFYDGMANLYAGNATTVVRYSVNTGVQTVFATGGLVNGAAVPFSNVMGLGTDGNGDLFVGDDSTLGRSSLQGRLWIVAPKP